MNLDTLINMMNFMPHRLEYPSAWIGHMPFASWLADQIRASVFVELGTHYGHSYFSVCESVKNHDLKTKCYAIDNWLGEKHSGIYGEEVYVEVKNFNDTNYHDFSTLIRSDFNAAVEKFDDTSIDLFHIDGLHTYDAVKHDFETWLPKLARGAIVMLHDINGHEGDFGVWRFWEELCRWYPLHLEFEHSHGLGVLQLTGTHDLPRFPWLQTSSPAQALVKEFFRGLGNRVCENVLLQRSLAERDHRLTAMEKELKDSICRIATLEREKEAFETHAQQMEEDLACQEYRRNTLEQDADRLLEKVRGLREKVRETEVHAKDLRRQLYLINRSRIWRLRCKIIDVKNRLTGLTADNSDKAPPS